MITHVLKFAHEKVIYYITSDACLVELHQESNVKLTLIRVAIGPLRTDGVDNSFSCKVIKLD